MYSIYLIKVVKPCIFVDTVPGRGSGDPLCDPLCKGVFNAV